MCIRDRGKISNSKLDSVFRLVLKVTCANFCCNRCKGVDLYSVHMNPQTLSFIYIDLAPFRLTGRVVPGIEQFVTSNTCVRPNITVALVIKCIKNSFYCVQKQRVKEYH